MSKVGSVSERLCGKIQTTGTHVYENTKRLFNPFARFHMQALSGSQPIPFVRAVVCTPPVICFRSTDGEFCSLNRQLSRAETIPFNFNIAER